MIEIPVDGVDAVRFEKRIAFGEVLAAEKAIVRRRRGMHAFEHKVLRCSDEFLFAAGIAAPEQKDDRLLMLVQLFDYMVGEGRPAEVFMAVRWPRRTVRVVFSMSTPRSAHLVSVPSLGGTMPRSLCSSLKMFCRLGGG